jgi:hypothetical protein
MPAPPGVFFYFVADEDMPNIWIFVPITVLLKSIRRSPVTGVLDVTNFATLSRIT